VNGFPYVRRRIGEIAISVIRRGEMKTLALAAALLLVGIQSRADILIYKGTMVGKSGPATLQPVVNTVFMLFNPEANQIRFLSLFRDIKKVRLDDPNDVTNASAAILKGKTATILTVDTSAANPPNVANGLFYLRGTNATLKVATSGLTTLNQPRVFGGINFKSGISVGVGFFTEVKLNLVFQEKRTVNANDANQDLDSAGNTLVDEFKALGFTEQ